MHMSHVSLHHYSKLSSYIVSCLSLSRSLSLFLSLNAFSDNIPRRGPVIFTVNHANQFIDAVMVLCTCQQKISYLMAEASWKRRIIGDIAWALDVVPVKRAQDNAKPGTGTIQIHRHTEDWKKDDAEEETSTSTSTSTNPLLCTMIIRGMGTQFTKELQPGDKVRPGTTAHAFKVQTIVSDVELITEAAEIPSDFSVSKGDESIPYDILRHIPLTVVFQKVLDKLASGGAIGIFPEGGSHDRTDLLPLKIGISLIAYSALEKHGLNVQIVPVGLSYFRAHRWRGRAVVEYGRPIEIDPATLPDFKAGDAPRRKVCNDLLEQIETSMRSVLVQTPDYETLELLHTARRLYQKGPLTTSERQDLSRRFAQGYKKLLLLSEGNPPQEWLDLQERLRSYQYELKDLGLKDYQVIGTHRTFGRLLSKLPALTCTSAHLLCVRCLLF
jgi:glycerol-3-phosphate O-acyltransferase/dihydroxyacetone phosphate acyltransferase